ncbi:Protein ABHD17C [Dichanthelium oligosanthes]|uniref:Protein ABHD17C n=1 Tax=Dichanthelium oligosanthes TaxID=888268 RepID=A0A1E5UZ25_9POAL|nr:Protein ABHD17C [Dichanthelium oligosanthes]
MGGVTSSVASKMAFFPPSPPSYGVVDEEEPPPPPATAGAGQRTNATAAAAGGARKVATWRVAMTGVRWSVGVEARRVRTRRGSEIIAMYVRHPGASLTVLFSHGNAADLGQMYGVFVQLSERLRVNLMGEYDGYSDHTVLRTVIEWGEVLLLRFTSMVFISFAFLNEPSEANTFADIEAAYQCLVDVYGTREEDIVLYGQSVGSGPTLDLAVRFDNIRAVVLHSPILSGLRVLYSVKKTHWFDIYKNIDKIPHVKCPVLGTNDDVVHWSHGKRLWELCQHKYEPLWIEGGNHANLETFPVYTRHLKKFLSVIKKLPAEKEAAAESEKWPAENKTPSDDITISEVPSMISRRLEPSRKTTIHEQPMLGTEHVDKRRRSTGHRERARSSTDRKEKSRRSVDCFDRIDEHEQSEKPRKSFDRIGEKIRSMGLCNVDCFKEPSHSTEPCRGH